MLHIPGSLQKFPLVISVCETNIDPLLWLLSLLEEILFHLVSFLLHVGAVAGFRVSFTEKKLITVTY